MTTPVRVLDVLECGKTCDVLLTKVQVLVRLLLDGHEPLNCSRCCDEAHGMGVQLGTASKPLDRRVTARNDQTV